MAVLVARYGPGMYEPLAAVSLPAPGPFSWAGLLAGLSQQRTQQLLLGWAVRTVPGLLVSCVRLWQHRQVTAAATAAAAAAEAGVSGKKAAAAAPRQADTAPNSSGCSAAAGSSGGDAATAAKQPSPAAAAVAPVSGAGPVPLLGANGVGGAAAAAAVVANIGDLIRMAQLHPRATALKPGGWQMGMRACAWQPALTMCIMPGDRDIAQLGRPWTDALLAARAAASGEWCVQLPGSLSGPPAPCTMACCAGARSSLSYRSSLRHTLVSTKVQLPHERYADMSARLPGLIERALLQAAGGEAGAAALHQHQATSSSVSAQASAAVSVPRLLTYTHFQGCLAGVLQYASEQPLPPASRVEAELQQLLPEDLQLVRLAVQEVDSSSGASAPAGGVWPWPDPVAVESNSSSCSLDVVLHSGVLQQLPGGNEQQQLQLRVVLAVAGGEVLSDGVVGVDMQADLAGGGATVKVRTPAPPGMCCSSWALQRGCHTHRDAHGQRICQPVLPPDYAQATQRTPALLALAAGGRPQPPGAPAARPPADGGRARRGGLPHCHPAPAGAATGGL